MRIYRRLNSWQPNAVGFDDFYVEADEIPFTTSLLDNYFLASTPIGTFLQLQAMLSSLYVKHKVLRPITTFLQEFREHLPINFCHDGRRDDGATLVKPALAEAGFEVTNFFSYGRSLSVQFGWVAPQDRKNRDARVNLYVATVEFKPTPERTLGRERWVIPSNASVSYLLTHELIALSSREPLGLLSEAGKQAALANFNWTKVSLLTVREAKRARVDFVRDHPELHDDPPALARALIKAELYSDTAEVYAIKKQVPRLIKEAGGDRSNA